MKTYLRDNISQAGRQAGRQAGSINFLNNSIQVAANSAKIRRQHCMHDGKFSRSLRLGAMRFARVYGEGLRENRKNFAQNCKKSARDFKAKYLQNHKLRATSFARNRKTFAQPAGFTIIEVALVLAIAGLIFLVVFLALPALQKSQRDTARRQDVAKAVAAIQQYYADGGDGKTGMPTGTCGVGYRAIADDGSPLGPYLRNAGLSSNTTRVVILQMDNCTTSHPGAGALEITIGDKCGAKIASGGYSLVKVGSPYTMAVTMVLESSKTFGFDVDGANVICQTATR